VTARTAGPTQARASCRTAPPADPARLLPVTHIISPSGAGAGETALPPDEAEVLP
jgi:hypothetical protein